MQNPRGQIVSISADHPHGEVVVEVEAGIVCERCESGKGCGAGLFGKTSGDRRVTATVSANLVVGNGDIVSIALLPRNVLRAAILVYGYPLAGALTAVIGAYATGLNDLQAAAAAILGLLTGLIIARARLQNDRCLQDFMPMVVDKLPDVRR